MKALKSGCKGDSAVLDLEIYEWLEFPLQSPQRALDHQSPIGIDSFGLGRKRYRFFCYARHIIEISLPDPEKDFPSDFEFFGFHVRQDPFGSGKEHVPEAAPISPDVGIFLVDPARRLGDALHSVDSRPPFPDDEAEDQFLGYRLAFLFDRGDISGFLQGMGDIVREFGIAESDGRLPGAAAVLDADNQV
jgi:hypothetical protein